MNFKIETVPFYKRQKCAQRGKIKITRTGVYKEIHEANIGSSFTYKLIANFKLNVHFIPFAKKFLTAKFD